MSSEHAIVARGVSKAYRIYHRADRSTTLGEAISRRARHPLERQSRENFWALRDVSFDVPQGEIMAIVGRNGAGKSTLLKTLCRITSITEGSIDVRGRVGSLLEVGTGFHPELTGRENVYLNGSILGMRRREIDRQFDAIVEFSETEKFLDTQVKRFSTGMYMRLAFAVAAHLQCEILLVDEVLSVGDRAFQDRCFGKLDEVAKGGRTVLFVSHQMESVARLCRTGMLLDAGRVEAMGSIEEVISAYVGRLEQPEDLASDADRRHGLGQVRIVEVNLHEDTYAGDEEKVVDIVVERRKSYDGGGFFLACHLVDGRGAVVAQCDSRLVEYSGRLDAMGRHRARLRIRNPWLKPGRYRLDLFVYRLPGGGMYDEVHGAARFEVAPILPYPGTVNEEALARGLVFADFSFERLEGGTNVQEDRGAEHRSPAAGTG